jgi:hypothetical protein
MNFGNLGLVEGLIGKSEKKYVIYIDDKVLNL